MLLLLGRFGFFLAILFSTASSYNLTCHCVDSTKCHSNGYCERGCEKGWFGPGCQIGNVALGKVARQSSTFTDYGITYSAGLAVDGSMPGENARNCSHTIPLTASSGSSWWSVVLDTAQYYIITNVTIVNRNIDGDSGNRRRLTNFKILYSNDTEGSPNPSSNIWKECAEEKGTVGQQKKYTCMSTAIAKTVAVYLETDATYNQKAILTLCEVQIYGYQQYECPSGYTGPGCLLRACDQCALSNGRCIGDYGSCSYNVCPHQSLLPPECWITLSDYTEADIRAAATCNKLLYSVDLRDTLPNIAASLLQLQVSTSDGQVVENTTIPVRGVNSTTYNYSYAAADNSYEVSVKPFYCDIPNTPCFSATSSSTFKVSTGKREYVFSHNDSCVFVNVNSDTPNCEPPTPVQFTCQSDIVDGAAVNSSSSSICGLERGQRYNCSHAAIDKSNIIEWANASIVIEPLLSSPAPLNDITAVAGSVGGSVAVLVIIFAIIVVVYYRRQRNAKSRTSDVARNESVKSRAAADTSDVSKLSSLHSAALSVEEDEQTYCNMSGMTLQQFQLYVQDEVLIARRFSELQANEAHPCTHGKSSENKGKNRFQNILPYDVNRVRLDRGTNDYINASYIHGFSKSREYIAAQGPSPKTLEDFWHMVWQEKCSVIIMLTNYVEHAKRKCEKYFPFSKSNDVDFEVTVSASTVFDTHTVTVLSVRQGSEVRLAHHFHFLAWPDQSVPSHSAEVLLFYSRIGLLLKQQSLSSKGSLIVHCSAGVGRTGAYIAFDYLLQRYQSDCTVDVDNCVLKLRDQRMLMVQTKEQYLFLHRVVLYGLKTLRYIYDAAKLPTLARASASPGSSFSSEIATEWQELQALLPTCHEQSFAAALLPENRHKNRTHFLALESKRPMIGGLDGGSQLYINAVYCNGCYSLRAFIATQMPLRHTMDDFWLMVYDCQPSCIILLHDLPTDDEDCPRYWPEPGQSFTAGRLEVKCDLSYKEGTNITGMPGFGISLAPVSGRTTVSQILSTKLFTTSLWNLNRSTELPANTYDFVTVANALQTYFVQFPQQPIIVQCRDGVTQSGLFLSAVNALHRLIETQQVSVFHTVELLRTSRPEFVTSEILETYHDSSNIYTNA